VKPATEILSNLILLLILGFPRTSWAQGKDFPINSPIAA